MQYFVSLVVSKSTKIIEYFGRSTNSSWANEEEFVKNRINS